MTVDPDIAVIVDDQAVLIGRAVVLRDIKRRIATRVARDAEIDSVRRARRFHKEIRVARRVEIIDPAVDREASRDGGVAGDLQFLARVCIADADVAARKDDVVDRCARAAVDLHPERLGIFRVVQRREVKGGQRGVVLPFLLVQTRARKTDREPRQLIGHRAFDPDVLADDVEFEARRPRANPDVAVFQNVQSAARHADGVYLKSADPAERRDRSADHAGLHAQSLIRRVDDLKLKGRCRRADADVRIGERVIDAVDAAQNKRIVLPDRRAKTDRRGIGQIIRSHVRADAEQSVAAARDVAHARTVAEKGVVAAAGVALPGRSAEKRVAAARNIAEARCFAEEGVEISGQIAAARLDAEKRVGAAGRVRLTGSETGEDILRAARAQNAVSIDIKLRRGVENIRRSRPVQIETSGLRIGCILNIVGAAGNRSSRIGKPRVVRFNELRGTYAAEIEGVHRSHGKRRVHNSLARQKRYRSSVSVGWCDAKLEPILARRRIELTEIAGQREYSVRHQHWIKATCAVVGAADGGVLKINRDVVEPVSGNIIDSQAALDRHRILLPRGVKSLKNKHYCQKTDCRNDTSQHKILLFFVMDRRPLMETAVKFSPFAYQPSTGTG